MDNSPANSSAPKRGEITLLVGRTCPECSRHFRSEKEIKKEVLMDLWNLIFDDNCPLDYAESICVYIKMKLKELE